MSEPIEVGPDHILWKSWDDDDWNGATAARWLTDYAVPGARFCMTPSAGVSVNLLGRIILAILARGVVVEVRCTK